MIVSAPGSKIENSYVCVAVSDSSTVVSPLKNVVVGATLLTRSSYVSRAPVRHPRPCAAGTSGAAGPSGPLNSNLPLVLLNVTYN